MKQTNNLTFCQQYSELLCKLEKTSQLSSTFLSSHSCNKRQPLSPIPLS